MSETAMTGAIEAQGRRLQMLHTAFGSTIAAALADPAVIGVSAAGGPVVADFTAAAG